MTDAIAAHIGTVFVPVRDIEAARDWYCQLLGVAPTGEIQFGHLFVVPMQAGSGLVLDSKDFTGPHDRKPLFHFMSSDMEASRAGLDAAGIAHSGIRDGVFITFNDPDGNLLMVANVPLTPLTP